jgi:phosphoribosylanthranilate isomerase
MPYTRVKICGITNLADARVAVEAGADLLGFILYPRSPRYVEPGKIKKIIKAITTELEDSGLKIGVAAGESPSPNLQSSILKFPRFVGVFVNEPLPRVAAILAEAGLDYAQLHGDETPEMVAALEGRGFKALRPADADAATAQAERYAGLGPAPGPRWLVDAYDPHEYGGTGKRADWHVAAELARRYPGLLLAGGLTPDNVAAAIRTVRPWGVDVSSGVERSPGQKDHEKVRAFIRHVREKETER